MVDAIKLIRAVKRRDPLWDRKHVYYHNRNVNYKLWKEVAKELGVDCESVRAKWKSLRDTFRGELKKVNRSLFRGQTIDATNWEYFEEMLFVRDQIYSNKRSLKSMLHSGGDKTSSTPPSPEGEGANKFCEVFVKAEPRDSDSETDSVPEKKQKTIEINEDSADSEDDDRSFLMSILPHLRSLPVTRNLFVRLKIQELLYNEVLEADPLQISPKPHCRCSNR